MNMEKPKIVIIMLVNIMMLFLSNFRSISGWIAFLSARRNPAKAAIQPVDKTINCEIDCVLLLCVAVSIKVRESRKRVMVAASVAAPNTSSDFLLAIGVVCCGRVVVIV